jgi:DNA-binding NarL/FixJ family response regulator
MEIIITERQRQVLTWVVQGKSNKEIAREMGITEGTVKQHLRLLYDRIGIRSRIKIMALYISEEKTRTGDDDACSPYENETGP